MKKIIVLITVLTAMTASTTIYGELVDFDDAGGGGPMSGWAAGWVTPLNDDGQWIIRQPNTNAWTGPGDDGELYVA